MGKQSRRRIRSAKVARAKPAALGFRAHSGWAAAVVVGGSPGSPVVLDRRRIELIDSTIPGQPYHAAAEMSFSEAERFIAQCIRRTHRLACQAVKSVVDELRKPRSHDRRLRSALGLGSATDNARGHARVAHHDSHGRGRIVPRRPETRGRKVWPAVGRVKRTRGVDSRRFRAQSGGKGPAGTAECLGKDRSALAGVRRKAPSIAAWLALAACGEAARLQRVMPNRCRAVLAR